MTETSVSNDLVVEEKAPPSITELPGIQFIDHVAISVPVGELDGQVKAYEMLGFREIHREKVLGSDQVREVLLQMDGGPNCIQLLEPLSSDSPVAKMIA